MSKAGNKKTAQLNQSNEFPAPGDSVWQATLVQGYILKNSATLPNQEFRMPFAVRSRFEWHLRTRTLALGTRTLIMGILNVTPDSFSDGGEHETTAAALKHALEMLDEGADILDLGGESTRPNATPLTPAEEQARALPALRAILQSRPHAIVSIDTYHAETARLSVEAGAEIVNDVSGHLWDPQMAATCAALQCGAILMHTRGRPHQWRTQPSLAPKEVVPLVLRDLESRAGAALAAGIARDAIVLDPGFGFGKVFEENYPLLAGLDTLHTLGFPLLAGVSRKSFLTRAAVRKPESFSPHESDLWLPTTVANTAAILAGTHILRVHDVRPAREAAAIADRILQGTEKDMLL
jgi:dihydropteroate synthase